MSTHLLTVAWHCGLVFFCTVVSPHTVVSFPKGVVRLWQQWQVSPVN